MSIDFKMLRNIALVFMAAYVLNLFMRFIHEIARQSMGFIAYASAYALAITAFIKPTATGCLRRTGGIWDENPSRLTNWSFVKHKICRGRYEGNIYQDDFVSFPTRMMT
jgi:hypothetical protein